MLRCMAAQDPRELFDVVDARGRPLGFAKPRGEVHRDGDWHQALHVWVVLRDPEPRLLLQRRSLEKDTWPGAVDVAVGGHLRAGEGIAEALREAEEEIGLALALSEVVPLGLRAYANDRAPGVRDREIQHAFGVIVARPLVALRPDPEELAGLIAVPFAAARALYRGEAASASGEAIDLAGVRSTVTIRREDCVKSDDDYAALVMDALGALLEGRTPTPFALIAEGEARFALASTPR